MKREISLLVPSQKTGIVTAAQAANPWLFPRPQMGEGVNTWIPVFTHYCPE
jgi:hypothetical protein